jgi:hypothetical protein
VDSDRQNQRKQCEVAFGYEVIVLFLIEVKLVINQEIKHKSSRQGVTLIAKKNKVCQEV